jgi:hypothetical protein
VQAFQEILQVGQGEEAHQVWKEKEELLPQPQVNNRHDGTIVTCLNFFAHFANFSPESDFAPSEII